MQGEKQNEHRIFMSSVHPKETQEVYCGVIICRDASVNLYFSQFYLFHKWSGHFGENIYRCKAESVGGSTRTGPQKNKHRR